MGLEDRIYEDEKIATMIRFNRNIFLNNICLIYDMSVLQEAIFKNLHAIGSVIEEIIKNKS